MCLCYVFQVANKLTKAALLQFLTDLGAAAKSEGTCYLTGGASAVLIGWRDTTIDVDLKFQPEPEGVFDAIPELKRTLQLNVELAAPDDFIPPLPGWEKRSPLIGKYGMLTVRHYDFSAQALAKIERGHQKDIGDIEALLSRGLVLLDDLLCYCEAIRPLLKRYPAIEEDDFVSRVKLFVEEHRR